MTATAGKGNPEAERNGRAERRRRNEITADNVRYFLPKPDTTSEKPELGAEIANEGEALLEAFRSGREFFTLVVWRAVPDMSGREPKIVKEVVSKG